MSKTLYDWYVNSLRAIARYELAKKDFEPHELDEKIDQMTKSWQDIVHIVDESHPHLKEQYMRNQEIQKSFTREQIDFICYQIGEWYLDMKPLLEGQHNLGHMKEKLKTMICGDE